MNTKLAAPTTMVPSRISFADLVRKGGGVPDESKPVVFVEGQHQFRDPGTYASDPMKAKEVHNAEIDAMYEYIEQEETFDHGYNDVAVCLTRVLRACDSGIARSVKTSPFKLPSEMTVETGYDSEGRMRYETVPNDWMTIPGMDGQVRATRRRDGTGMVTFHFRRYAQEAIVGFLSYIRDELKHNSIYKGQIVGIDYSFHNVANFDRSQLVFNQDVAAAVEIAVVSPILDLDAIEELGERPRRSVLLDGIPGTGKTMVTKLAMSLLFDLGYGGVVVPPGATPEQFERGLRIARSMMTEDNVVGVFVEDIEKMATQNRALALDLLDGPEAKSDRALIIMTTNFSEQIQDDAFVRPGRVDDYIVVGLPDRQAFEKLIRLRLRDMIADDVDFDAAFPAFADYTPAWIVGGVSKVLRAVVARTHSAENIKVTTADLINGANLLRPQFELQKRVTEYEPEKPPIDTMLRELIWGTHEDASEQLAYTAHDATDYEAVTDAARYAIDGASVYLEDSRGNEISGNINT